MKVITCTGYGATGSSVASDFLKEFDTVKSYGDFEFRFIQDPHGLRDLEYGLFENNNRLNTDYFIKQFIQYTNFLSKSLVYNYEKHFKGNFKTLSDDFVNKIIDGHYQGYWHQDIIDESLIKKFTYYLERFIQKKILKKKESASQFYKNRIFYAKPISKEIFYSKVKKYTDSLIDSLSFNENCNFLVLDQLVPPDHHATYLNYFSNLKVIIVDRDPRDLFLLEKYEYREAFVPLDTVENFCKWFRIIREHQKSEIESDNVLYLHFEDFIYDYENTVTKVLSFLEINYDLWNKKGVFFQPEISIKNTKKWELYHDAKDAVSYIEKELPEFLVHY